MPLLERVACAGKEACPTRDQNLARLYTQVKIEMTKRAARKKRIKTVIWNDLEWVSQCSSDACPDVAVTV